jgi:hypothetical protein
MERSSRVIKLELLKLNAADDAGMILVFHKVIEACINWFSAVAVDRPDQRLTPDEDKLLRELKSGLARLRGLGYRG